MNHLNIYTYVDGSRRCLYSPAIVTVAVDSSGGDDDDDRERRQQGILIWFKFQKQIYILAFSIVHQTVSHAICLRIWHSQKDQSFI